MRIHTELLRKFFGKSRRSDFLGDFQAVTFAEDGFRRAVGYALCFVVFGLVSMALALNYWEGNQGILFPLGGVLLGALCAFAWLWTDDSAVYGPLYLLLAILALLGGYLLLERGAPDGSSLFWFLIFPPMVMLCLGLDRGVAVFVFFFAFLVLFMATPLHARLATPLSEGVRLRFLFAMLGAFAFSWCAEFFRYQTQSALGRTMTRLKQDSLTDPLTGLGNRRDFYTYCNWLMESSGRPPVFSLAIADLDHFKRINDTYGHDVGDKVLQHVAEVLGAHIRASDKLYRWGGEEFLVLMPKTASQDARLALERMRATVEVTPYEEKGLCIPFTVSIGLYSGVMSSDLNTQISKADQNLYAAKAGGRNRVVG